MPACAIVLCLLLVTSDNLWAKATALRQLFVWETGINKTGNLLTLRGNTPFPNRFVADANYPQHGWRVQVELGVALWGLRVYLRPNLQSAFDHQQSLPRPLNQGVYFINESIAEDAKLSKLDFMSLATSTETRIALYEGGEWHDGQDNLEMDLDKWRYLTFGEFSNYLPDEGNLAKFPITSIPATELSSGLSYYVIKSFVLPKVIGINHGKTLDDRRFRKIFNKTNDRLASGYRLLFNAGNIEEVIEALQVQQRRKQLVTMNRYRSEAIADKLRKAFAEDKAFTVTLVDQQNELVAGVVGYVHGNRFNPDSVFGNDINDIKITDVALMRYLTAHQIEFVDAGMVTSYTASLGGYRVSREQFEQLVTELPEQPVVLPKGWQGAISTVVATKKTSQRYLQHLVNRGEVSDPLLLITTSSPVRPHLQKAGQRRDGLREVLAKATKVSIIEANRQPQLFDGLPVSLVPYLQKVLAIDVDVIGKVSIMKVTTMSGFPIPLLDES